MNGFDETFFERFSRLKDRLEDYQIWRDGPRWN